ncbi:MAG: hypothetical protein ACRDPT_14805 [Streptomycetales bacterium]
MEGIAVHLCRTRPRTGRARIGLAALAVLTALATAVVTGAPASGEEEGGPDRPDDWLLSQRAFPDENIPPNAYQDAIEQVRELRASSGRSPSFARGDWTLAGPTNIGGRVTDIAVDTDEPETVYAAAATGGGVEERRLGADLRPGLARGPWPVHGCAQRHAGRHAVRRHG